MKKVDLTNKVFGHLTVLKESDVSGEWICQCDCGKITIKKGRYLVSGETKSCGDRIHKGRHLEGQRFGRLVVQKHVGYKNNEKLWECLCDCGNIVNVIGGSLTSGRTKSCGCYNLEKCRERMSALNPYIDLTGQKFGLLTALYIDSTDGRGEKKWMCQCECGKKVIVLSSNLRNGHTQSCGCSRRSHGEMAIEKLLKDNNIPFVIEKTFDSCRFQDTNINARFDFFVNNQYIIEYDGETHYNNTMHGWHTEDKLEETQKRDEFKNNWCLKNNIPLIRIPYTHLKQLKITDLLLETSEFLIKNKE